MKASIKNLIAENPSGLLEMKPSLSVDEHRDNDGFGLNKIFTIYKSRKIHHTGQNWFEFGKNFLSELFNVRDESTGDLLVVFIAEIIKENRVYCYLVLTDEAFKGILNDKNQHVLQVHQMYTMFWKNHIALNMAV